MLICAWHGNLKLASCLFVSLGESTLIVAVAFVVSSNSIELLKEWLWVVTYEVLGLNWVEFSLRSRDAWWHVTNLFWYPSRTFKQGSLQSWCVTSKHLSVRVTVFEVVSNRHSCSACTHVSLLSFTFIYCHVWTHANHNNACWILFDGWLLLG